MDLVRSLVSKQKRRWNDEGFNLDLTYITDNIIAMGFPSEGTEGLFRNPLSEVQHFLKQRHGDRFFVYNLCIERSYRPEKFDGRVGVFPFAGMLSVVGDRSEIGGQFPGWFWQVFPIHSFLPSWA